MSMDRSRRPAPIERRVSAKHSNPDIGRRSNGGRDIMSAMRTAALALAAAFALGALGAKFDPKMKGCEKSCALRVKYDKSEVAPQPGAAVGKVARCPVSGVFFRVREESPKAAVAGAPYRFCCASCARIFGKDPKRFIASRP